MTSKRLQNIAFVFAAMAVFTVYSSAKALPIKTSGLFSALFMAFASYAISSKSARAADRERSKSTEIHTNQSIKKDSEQ